jgi:hypothetical protein
MCAVYNVLKDFAGPVATVIAAGAATWITWRLGSRQISIAAGQAQTASAQKWIAYVKLKHDLFRLRYEVYQAAKDAIELVLKTGPDQREIVDPDLTALRIKIDEARFFFPEREVAIFRIIEELITRHEFARAEWIRFNEDDVIRFRTGDAMADAIAELSEYHRQLPALLTAELGFGQFTTPD